MNSVSAAACSIEPVPAKFVVMCSDEIFFGKVKSIKKTREHAPGVDRVITVNVTRSLKGSASGQVKLFYKQAYSDGMGECTPGAGVFKAEGASDMDWIFLARKEHGYLFTDSVTHGSSRVSDLSSTEKEYVGLIKGSSGKCSDIDPKWVNYFRSPEKK